ncbi:NUDIX domain-containing protein [Candidatus Pacearchaeota archaeon]|nr:NUDIX domain-containing protein [Candidatus Pacearchaeota archaeon]
MKTSSGILIYRIKNNKLEIFLVHNGGPFFKNKDEGYWSIPKGEIEEGETTEKDFLNRAILEVKEETGIELPKSADYIYLGTIKQKNNKLVHAWAIDYNWQGLLRLNYLTLEYPKNRFIKIPEVDKAEYFSEKLARKKINQTQIPFIERLKEKIRS